MLLSELAKKKPSDDGKRVVSVKLSPDIIEKVRKIRKETKKTNSQIYTALVAEGITAYEKIVSNGKTKTRKRS